MTEQFANNAASILVLPMDASQLSLTVQSAVSFPTTGQFRLLIDNELMLCSAVVGAVFTVTRGIEGTVPTTHDNYSPIILPLTAGSILAIAGSSFIPYYTSVFTLSSSLAAGATDSTEFALIGRAGIMFMVNTDHPARVRAYCNTISRSNDLSRPVGTAPTAGIGLLLETVTTALLPEIHLTPPAPYSNEETVRVSHIALSIANNDVVTRIITVELNVLILEV